MTASAISPDFSLRERPFFEFELCPLCGTTTQFSSWKPSQSRPFAARQHPLVDLLSTTQSSSTPQSPLTVQRTPEGQSPIHSS